jgi:large subunit ribosomal protein L18e
MIEALKVLSYEKEAPIWKEISKRLAKSSRNMPGVNVGSISRNTKAGEQVAVVGKVLGSGELDHPIIVACVGFSDSARKKIVEAGGECIGLLELVERNPKGSNVKIIA